MDRNTDTETDWKVENHGVNGRSIPHTVSTVKFACQQVRDWHRKPNSVWLLVMLGTNDLLENPDFTAADVAKRMERFLKRMMEEAGLASRKMRLRLIAPPAMQEGQWVDRPELLTESRNLGKEYKGLQSALGLLLQMPVDGKSRQFTMEFILRKKDTVFLQKTFEKN